MDPKEAIQELEPFFEALKGLEKIGFRGIAKAQTVVWPLSDERGPRHQAVEIIVELRKDLAPV